MNLFRKLYDITHPFGPECIGCGHTYNKSGSLKFEYHNMIQISSITVQPSESPLEGHVTMHLDTNISGLQPGQRRWVSHPFRLGDLYIKGSGIEFCSDCIDAKPKERLIDEAYKFMTEKWNERIPDLEEFQLNAYIQYQQNRFQ